jgi:hypothetical protein
MKRFLLLALAAFGLFAQTPAARSVYLLPMTGGLDQYLAERIAHDHIMPVVANPKAADLVLTDRLGEGFEQKMESIYPLQPKKDDGKEKPPEIRHFQSAAARGTVFLVDAKTRQVLWSDYEKPTRGGLDRTAAAIAKKLQTFGK